MTEAERQLRHDVAVEETVAGRVDSASITNIAIVLAEIDRLTRERDSLANALVELHATVIGECPSLLNGDSGGSSMLIALIADAFAQLGKERGNG